MKIANKIRIQAIALAMFAAAGSFVPPQSLAVCKDVEVSGNPKREFRGAWLHVIGRTQWQGKTTEQAKRYIDDQFRKLQDAGCNAVIFQVRPTADAMYKSELEPWTAWLTGKRGKAPSPEWDPMEYAIEQATKGDGVSCMAESISRHVEPKGHSSGCSSCKEGTPSFRQIQRTDFLRPCL